MNVKAYSWRLTALYIWIKMLAALFGFYAALSAGEFLIVEAFRRFLSSVGFAPINIGYLPTTFAISWLLIITAFKPLELIGLFFYTISFPLWSPFGLLALSKRNTEESATKSAKSGGLISRGKEGFRIFALSLLLLVAWFLLYGGASEQRLMYPGVFLTGVFLSLLIYRQFLRVRPINDQRSSPFGWARLLSAMLDNSTKDQVKKGFAKKSELTTSLTANTWARKNCIRLALLLRGRGAERRAALFVLADFIISLVVVGAVAILFWGLLMKAVAPAVIPLTSAIRISASHFLPGMQSTDLNFDLPQWSTFGAAATAWILFVVYIGPAGVFLPGKQKQTIQRLNQSYLLFRNLSLILGERQRFLLSSKQDGEIGG